MTDEKKTELIKELIAGYVEEATEEAHGLCFQALQQFGFTKAEAFDLVLSCQISALASYGALAGAPPIDWIVKLAETFAMLAEEAEARGITIEYQGQTGNGGDS